MSLANVLKPLLSQYPTASALHEFLAGDATRTRTEPATYDALLKEGLDAAAVKTLDAALSAAGLDWLARQFAGSGVDLSSEKVRTVLSETLGDKDAEPILSIGVRTVPQWQEYGLTELPALQEITEALTPLQPDGYAISAAVNVTPQQESVALSVTELAGNQRLRQVHSFAASQASQARLTAKQRALYDALTALLRSYDWEG